MKLLLIALSLSLAFAEYTTENVDFSMQGENWDDRCYVGIH